MKLPSLSGLAAFADRQGRAVTFVGLLAFAGSATVAGLTGIPEPRTHDEFSYLLAADTFAHGRLTNPTHPLWVHFESIHILQQPTYASKFPPAQGMILALGQRLTGRPIVGVWLSVGLMCAAICWMLYAWVPPRWAFVGGLLAVAQLGIVDYWAQSYWGGAMAATGGALVFGALRRILSAPRASHAIVMGLGVAILANSRPYEGLIASLPAGITLLTWMLTRHGPRGSVSLKRIVLPLCAVLALAAAGMVWLNLRVTGNPLRLPYQVHEATYRVEPVFLWKSPRPEPTYRHKELHDFYAGFEIAMYRNQHPIGRYGYRAIKTDQFYQLWRFFLGPWLTIPLVMLPWTWRDPWVRFALLTIGCLAVGLLGETWVLKHYAAPITGLIFALAVQGLQAWKARAGPAGRFVVWMVVLASVTRAIVLAGSDPAGGPRSGWHLQRAAIVRQLQADGGRHLVLVRYGSRHSVQQEWVYNDADIDTATVVWARAMDPESDRQCVEYFRDRTIWLLDVDSGESAPVVAPYAAARDR